MRRSPRHRRACFGELVQIDGSPHAWFEDRGPRCTLLVYIDDATGRLMELRFVEVESAFDYFASTVTYLRRHGKPVAFYSDKHSIFRRYDSLGLTATTNCHMPPTTRRGSNGRPAATSIDGAHPV